MTNKIYVPKTHLIMALCLPLAVLIGYLLAEPMESSGIAVALLVVSLLCMPLLARWYYQLLLLSCNALLAFYFLPGTPPLWLPAAILSFAFAIINRCVDPERRLLVGGAIPWALLVLAAVVGLTALMTGGAGLKILGGSSYGGKFYIYITGAILAYFALASYRVAPSRAMLYASLFFLSGLTGLLSLLTFLPGQTFSFLMYVVPSEALNQPIVEVGMGGTRIGGLNSFCVGGCLLLLLHYGIKGILNFRKPWRLALLLLVLAAGLYSGFRSMLVFLGLVFGIAFFLEGLHRTGYLARVLCLGLIAGACLAGFSTKLPMVVQRALSFLPVEVSPAAKLDAQASLDWRFDMWRRVAADIPRYLLKGKGYAVDPSSLYMAGHNDYRGFGHGSEWAEVAGEFHNGPLSVLIPFGIWGALALGWFFVAVGRALYRNMACGNPELKGINRVLLAVFLARITCFIFFGGCFYIDLGYFTFLAGLAVSLNRDFMEAAHNGEEQQQQEEAVADLESAGVRDLA